MVPDAPGGVTGSTPRPWRGKRLASVLGPVASLALFGVALVLLRRELSTVSLGEVVQELQSLPLDRLLAAAGATVLSYLALTLYDWLALLYLERELPYRRVALASFVGYSFSNTVGHTLLTGAPIRLRFYSAWGLTAVEVAKVVGFCALTFWVGFLSSGGLAFVIAPTVIPAGSGLPLQSTRMLGVVLLAIVVAYLVVCAAKRRPLLWRGWELAVVPPRLAAAQVALGLIDWALAAAVLYALLPASGDVTYMHLLGAFLLAQILGQASQVPGGLGVFETSMVLLLRDVLPVPQLLGSLVAYRLLYYFLPLAVAAILLLAHELLARRTAIRRVGAAVGRAIPGVVPQALAVTTFIGGAVLLASGATPAEPGRLAWLRGIVPLPLVELSHLTASVAGAGLLVLARGLQRRLDGAFALAAVLLAAGIVGSLVKGLDWEEALVLSLLLLALLASRRDFYRRSSLLGERFSVSWAIAVLATVGGSLWLGLFAHRHVQYSAELWWQFAFHGDAPRFLRASVVVVSFLLVVGAARLLRAARPLPPAPGLDTVRPLVAEARETAAKLALLGDKRFLISPSGRAFLMYAVEGRSWVAMGDPVGPPPDQEELVWQFREATDAHDDWPVFYLVRPDTLHLYLDLGLDLLKLGEEAHVDLAAFSLDGGTRKTLRQTVRRLEKEGMRFEIAPSERIEELLPRLRVISDAWLAVRNTREKGFSLGSFDPAYLRNFPAALVHGPRGAVAFANLWIGAGHNELSIDLMRHLPDAPNGVMDFLFVNLMLWGRSEGFRTFNLGMAPLSGLESRRLAPLWSRVGALAFQHGEHFYNFQGLRQYKEKFGPSWEPRYLASPGGLTLPRVLANVAALINRGLKGVVAK